MANPGEVTRRRACSARAIHQQVYVRPPHQLILGYPQPLHQLPSFGGGLVCIVALAVINHSELWPTVVASEERVVLFGRLRHAVAHRLRC